MLSKRSIATTALLAALTAGAVVPTALAQDAPDQPAGDATEQSEREERRAERHAEFAAALAAELGLDAETVAEALEAVRDDFAEQRQDEHRARLEERLAAAVEAGDLTQEQADALLDAQEAGVFRGLGGPRGHRPGGLGGPGGFGPLAGP